MEEKNTTECRPRTSKTFPGRPAQIRKRNRRDPKNMLRDPKNMLTTKFSSLLLFFHKINCGRDFIVHLYATQCEPSHRFRNTAVDDDDDRKLREKET